MELIIGFGGALIGALVTALFLFVLELWRQVLEFRAAARVVRYEIQENINRCVLAAKHQRNDLRLEDEAWRSLRMKLAPLLPREVYLHFATDYGAIFLAQEAIGQLGKRHEEASTQIDSWLGNIKTHPALLRQVEERSRLAQLFDALLGRPTFPPPVKEKSEDSRGWWRFWKSRQSGGQR